MPDAVDVTGWKELQRTLDTLEPKMSKRALRKGTRKGAQLVADMARSLVPVDEGDLEGTITVRAQRRSRTSLGHNMVVGTEQGGGEAYYAGFVNFGTRFQQADLFATQAFQTMWPAAEQTVIKETRAFLSTLGPGNP